LGDSFAGGTVDGPGDFDFEQGTNNSDVNPYWNYLAYFILSDPTPEEIACQAPKPILLNVGDLHWPVDWSAAIIPLQMARIGDLWIVAPPAELTTMAGRRLRDTVLQTLQKYNVANNNTVVVIAGLSNQYTHYVTTYEEFQYQRYEGASTLFGPHTLAAYQMLFSSMAQAIATGNPVPHGPNPPNLAGQTPAFLPPHLFDEHPIGMSFGSVDTDANPSYTRGQTVVVKFWGANPRNDLRTQDTFLTVELSTPSGWQVVAVDGDWETKYQWTSSGLTGEESLISCYWDIPSTATPGSYRIRTFGKWKDILGTLTAYTGVSRTFTVS